jgi:hypothetical protein
VIGHGDVINLSILLAQLGLRRKFLGKRPRRNSPSYQTFAIPNVPFTSIRDIASTSQLRK